MDRKGSDLGEGNRKLDCSTSSRQSAPPSEKESKRNAKIAEILDACRWRDLERLRALAVSEGGLVLDDVRRQAWPLLLGYQDLDTKSEVPRGRGFDDWRQLPKHRDEHQVQLDVDRSFIYYPNDQSTLELDRRKAELSELITEVLRRQPYLYYFQGYHDICQVFLLVLSPPNRAPAVSRLSALRIRDFMLPTLSQSLAQLQLIPDIISTVNPNLRRHLSECQPFFALSGTLTMYAHDIQEYGEIARLFDVLLAREAVFSVYMFAMIVLNRSEELFETPADEPEMLHSILSKLPKPLDIEKLIEDTVHLFEHYPPEQLRGWRSISEASVLKTARWGDVVDQTMEDGEAYFKQQEKELRRAEQRKRMFDLVWKYRRPAMRTGLAVLALGLAFLLRKSSGPSGTLGTFWRWYSGYKGH